LAGKSQHRLLRYYGYESRSFNYSLKFRGFSFPIFMKLLGADPRKAREKTAMPYDPDSVLRKYQRILEASTEDPLDGNDVENPSELSQCSASGCEGSDCQNCCVGVVEWVRQFAEKPAVFECEEIRFTDTVAQARKVSAGGVT
jgi:hypothetical protein